ncbi:MAG: alkaline phosphatase D family protein [Actinomycetota bacterium]|nr:alkaline phosphatase D family protein [Actinomycetota bacterium]
MQDLDDYRTRYAQYRRDPDLHKLHQRHPFINIVDDHEFCNDTWRDDVLPERIQADWWYVRQVHVRDSGVHHGSSWMVPMGEDRVRRAAGPIV